MNHSHSKADGIVGGLGISAPTAENQTSSARGKDFARRLRALGQALEKFGFSAFDLELRSGTYLVKGMGIPCDNPKFSFSRFVRDLVRGAAAQAPLSCLDSVVDLRFSHQEVEHFDLRGRTKRENANKMPDPYSISQILRGAGSYLDNRDVTQWICISLKGKWVTLAYETAQGQLQRSQQDLEYFYDYWVKMYLRRSNRVKPAIPSDPTVLVTWESLESSSD